MPLILILLILVQDSRSKSVPSRQRKTDIEREYRDSGSVSVTGWWVKKTFSGQKLEINLSATSKLKGSNNKWQKWLIGEKTSNFLPSILIAAESPIRKDFNRYTQTMMLFTGDLNSNVKPCPITVMGLMTIYSECYIWIRWQLSSGYQFHTFT